ncbi:MAG: IS4 family transposase [Chloroflexota bacterium]|nr:IS4 family transposase [Chloroflexota bacterium]
MGFTIREIEAECKFASTLTVGALERAVPPSAIHGALAQHGLATERERKLTLDFTVWLIIALHLYPTVAIAGVVRKLARGLRFIWPDPTLPLPTDSAVAYRRAQVGARPMVTLFKQVCQPIATPQTRGAFLFGLRLMALDGTTEDVPDTPANAARFGRHASARGASAFPQLQGVYLVECGTHCVVDAGFWPCHTSERVGGFRLLRSVGRGMLLLWDRGFHDFDMVVATRRRGAHVLSRLPAGVKPQVVRGLPDGSVLAYLLPSEDARRRRGECILVRVITYTITDPALPGYGEEHRVITTLLNPRLAPAHAAACAYHERWEVELVIDEIDTHQRLVGRTLRSRTPAGVIQELYGVLLAHYAVRVLMHEAALTVDEDPDRLSFVHALEVVRDAVPEFQMVAAEQQGALHKRLLQDIAAKRLPERRYRSNARVVKRKMSNFKLKRAEHYRPPTAKATFAEAVQVQPPPVLELPPRQQATQDGLFVELRQREPVLI